MQYAMPFYLTILCLLFAAVSLVVHILSVSTALASGFRKRSFFEVLRLFGMLAACFIWTLLLLLASNSLTFSEAIRLPLRWSVAAVVPICAAAAFAEHDWTSALPAIPLIFTLPFFENSFGPFVFPFVLLVMLFLLCGAEFVCFAGERRSWNMRKPALSVQEGIDSLNDGILFATPGGRILLMNSIIANLSSSLCRTSLRNANRFWDAVTEFESTELATKIEHNGSILIRFAGGNTWAFYREEILLRRTPVVQITALNVTESDQLRKTINMKKLELSRISQSAIEAKDIAHILSLDREKYDTLHSSLDAYCTKTISVMQELQEISEVEEACALELAQLSEELKAAAIRFD